MPKAKKPAGYYSKAEKAKRAARRAKMRARPLTEHQQNRRAAKSAKFFAKHAARAALAGNEKETRRLHGHMTRFDNIRRMVGAVLAVRAARFRIERAAA